MHPYHLTMSRINLSALTPYNPNPYEDEPSLDEQFQSFLKNNNMLDTQYQTMHQTLTDNIKE